MTNEQYDILINEFREIKARLDDIESNRAKDMESFQDWRVRLEGLESEVKATRQAINRNSETVKNKVADVVEPVIGALDSFEKQVEKSKMIIIKEKSWWKRIFKHGKVEHISVESGSIGGFSQEATGAGSRVN